MAWGRSTQVARADVEFHAETGQFEAEVRHGRDVYTRAVEDMGAEARRMSVAQEKLDRAIHKFGPTSLQARQAGVNYERELTNIRRELDRTRSAEDRLRHSTRLNATEITRSGRGAIAASGAFKGLGNALFFASGAFAGGFGLIYALRTTIQAATKAQTSIVKLSVAVGNAGVAWRAHRQEIVDTIDAQSKLSAFDDEELQDSFSRAIIRTKDLSQAFRLNAIAADYARASGRSLEQSMTLVLRASLGQTASLRRLGIEAQEVTTEQDRLSQAARQYGVVATFAQRRQRRQPTNEPPNLRSSRRSRPISRGSQRSSRSRLRVVRSTSTRFSRTRRRSSASDSSRLSTACSLSSPSGSKMRTRRAELRRN
jgi:hypothetical protein